MAELPVILETKRLFLEAFSSRVLRRDLNKSHLIPEPGYSNDVKTVNVILNRVSSRAQMR